MIENIIRLPNQRDIGLIKKDKENEKDQINHKNVEIKYLSSYYTLIGWIFQLKDRDSDWV